MTDLQPLITAIQDGAFVGAVLSKAADAPGLLYTIDTSGRPVLVDTSDLQERPAEKRGRYQFTRPGDFGRYVLAHAERGSAIFVDPRRGEAHAIIDGHAPGPIDATGFAGHGRHVATLALRWSASWERIQRGVNTLTQEQFADWLDDIRDEIRSMPAEELIELVDTLHVFSSANQKEVRASGHGRSIAFADDVTVKAGKAGVELPNKIVVESTVYDGVPKAWRFEVRLSVVASPGQPTRFKVSIPRLTDVVEAATDEAMSVVADVLADGSVPIYAGSAQHGGSVSARIVS